MHQWRTFFPLRPGEAGPLNQRFRGMTRSVARPIGSSSSKMIFAFSSYRFSLAKNSVKLIGYRFGGLGEVGGCFFPLTGRGAPAGCCSGATVGGTGGTTEGEFGEAGAGAALGGFAGCGAPVDVTGASAGVGVRIGPAGAGFLACKSASSNSIARPIGMRATPFSLSTHP